MNFKKYSTTLFEPVNATGIDAFRRIFAFFLIIQIYSFYSANIINYTFVLNQIRIPFDFAAWIPLLPGKMMNLVLFVEFIGAVLLFSIKYARIGALIYLISFGYLLMVDVSYYNNHFYFILLLCLFFVFYNPLKIGTTLFIPKILLNLFKFQVIVVYFFAGVVKLNTDWLINLEPMGEIMRSTGFHWNKPMLYFYAYAGTIFDLFIGFALLFPKLLKPAIILNILFHLSNFIMFESGQNQDIGIFPFLMISTNLLFINADKLQNWLAKNIPFLSIKANAEKKSKTSSAIVFDLSTNQKKWTINFVVFYILIQLFLPFRHFLIRGDVDWTSEGFYFAWRLKVRSKTSSVVIKLKDGPNSELMIVNPYNFLNTLQYKAVCDNPAAMHSFMQQLKNKASGLGMKQPLFYLTWYSSMNGHSKQLMMDSTLEFGSLKHKIFGKDEWILPFNKNL